jgi:hypothetical protein
VENLDYKIVIKKENKENKRDQVKSVECNKETSQRVSKRENEKFEFFY